MRHLAAVRMPKTAMYKDRFLAANEREIGFAADIGPVEAVAIAE